MRTHKILDGAGNLYAFEIGNFLVSGSTLARILKTKLGAVITSPPTAVISKTDIRQVFQLHGSRFIVEETFGDNSRYWVGPEASDGVRDPLSDQIHEVISQYLPGPLGWFRSLWANHRAA